MILRSFNKMIEMYTKEYPDYKVRFNLDYCESPLKITVEVNKEDKEIIVLQGCRGT